MDENQNKTPCAGDETTDIKPSQLLEQLQTKADHGHGAGGCCGRHRHGQQGCCGKHGHHDHGQCEN